MLAAVCVMGALLGFSFAINIVMFVAYGQQVKEVARMKVVDGRDKIRARVEADIEKSRNKSQEVSE